MARRRVTRNEWAALSESGDAGHPSDREGAGVDDAVQRGFDGATLSKCHRIAIRRVSRVALRCFSSTGERFLAD